MTVSTTYFGIVITPHAKEFHLFYRTMFLCSETVKVSRERTENDLKLILSQSIRSSEWLR